jgi:hypothetical protein
MGERISTMPVKGSLNEEPDTFIKLIETLEEELSDWD